MRYCLILSIVCLFAACGDANNNSEKHAEQIDVVDSKTEVQLGDVSNGYFLKNSIELGEGLNCMVATSQDVFDEYFGYGAVMGQEFTPIDFNTNNVLVLAMNAKDHFIELFIQKAEIVDNDLKVYCQVHKHEADLGYESTPLAMVSVAKNDNVKSVSFYNNDKLVRKVEL